MCVCVCVCVCVFVRARVSTRFLESRDTERAFIYGYKFWGTGIGASPFDSAVEKLKQLVDVLNRCVQIQNNEQNKLSKDWNDLTCRVNIISWIVNLQESIWLDRLGLLRWCGMAPLNFLRLVISNGLTCLVFLGRYAMVFPELSVIPGDDRWIGQVRRGASTFES